MEMKNNKMIKVVFIIDSLSKGGKERRLVELIKSLGEREMDMHLVLLTDIIHFEEIRNANVKIHILKRGIKKDPTIFFRLFKLVRAICPDIINSWGLMPGFYSLPIAKLLGIPFVNSMIVNAPEKMNKKRRIISALTLPFSDVVLANSKAGLKCYGMEGKRSKVIYNGYDFSRSVDLRSTDEIRKELNIPDGMVVGMVAGFRRNKDYKTFILTAIEIIKERNDAIFLMVGDGDTHEESKELSAGSKRIIFAGRRSDAEALIRVFDIGVLATFTEGISNSIMEYMSLGKPVVATDGGGTKEIVIDGVTGYLVKRQDVNDLKTKILKLLDDKNLRDTMGEEGKKRIETEFSMEKMTESYFEVFKELKENKGRKK
jgi:glycosyltransferase involved in cell wall biosynthesis